MTNQSDEYSELEYDNLDSDYEEMPNLCVSCGMDLGYCNPRQYCQKTYCPDMEFSNAEIIYTFYSGRRTMAEPAEPLTS